MTRRMLLTLLLALCLGGSLSVIGTAPAGASVTKYRELAAGSTVNDRAPNSSSWGTAGVVGVGYDWKTRKRTRSYLQFDTAALKGKRIIGAELNIQQVKAASCRARTTELYATSRIGRTTTWRKQPTRYPSPTTSIATAGCWSNPDMVGFDITAGIARAARTGSSVATFLLRARYEGDSKAYKQFDRSTAYIAVEYVSTPGVPSGVAVLTGSSTRTCGAAAKPTLISATSLRLRAMPSTPDGLSADLSAVWRRRDVTAAADLPLTKTDALDGSPTELGWQVEDGHTYQFDLKVRSYYQDPAGTTKYVDSGWTTACYFAIDVTPPAAPVLTSQDYAECTDVACPVQGTAGETGTIQVGSLEPDSSFSSRLITDPDHPNDDFFTMWEQPDGLNIVPRAGVNYLQAFTEDRAGNRSALAQFKFMVNPRPSS